MAKVSPLQENFNAGEFSPLLYGRVSLDRYRAALATCKNYIPSIQGGLMRRPGTSFVSEVKDSSKSTRLQAFEFSTDQAYILEFGDEYIRFFKDNAIITLAGLTITGISQAATAVVTSVAHGLSNGDRIIITGVAGMVQVNNREFIVAGVTANTFQLQTTLAVAVNSTGYTAYASGGTASEIYEIVSPYDHSDVFELKFTQSADTLYITHPDYAPRKLTRTGHTAWTISVMVFSDGPYLAVDPAATTLTPSATTGTITLTAGSGLFSANDVGRLYRLKHGSTWGWATVTGYTSATVVDATVGGTFGATTATTTWRAGVWSIGTGYPSCSTFHEDRLFFSGTPNYPQRLDGSKSGDYQNFAPTASDGTVAADNAVSFSLNANDVNATRWLSSDEKGLQVGTVGGEWGVKASASNEALSPTNITAKRSTSYGSANVQPVQVGKSALFIQRAGRKLREMTYYFDVDGFRAENLTVLSEHVLQSGVVQIAYQKEPQSIVWCVRADGVLATMTYERDLDSLKVGWARQIIGGLGDAAGNSAYVNSVAVIPAADETRDEAWVIVERYINGSVRQYIEYITKFFDEEDNQQDAFFVDSGLTYDVPKVITAITQANPAVVTSTAHGFSNGDRVRISEVEGMTELNGETFTVAGVTANTFQLSGINSTAYTAYVTGGEARKLVSTVSGLFHLEGQTVSILADGAVLPSVMVTSGIVTLPNSATAAVIHLGFGYNSDGQLLRPEAGAADGTALGKTRRMHRVGILMHRSLGLKIGMNFDELTTLVFRTSSDSLSRPPELFSGIRSETVDANYDFENQFCWRQDQPLPSTILAIMPQMVTQDRG